MDIDGMSEVVKLWWRAAAAGLVGVVVVFVPVGDTQGKTVPTAHELAAAGRLRLLVVDEQNVALPGAAIAVYRDDKSKPVFDGRTNSIGEFHLEGLDPARRYTVTISFPGFAPTQLSFVSVSGSEKGIVAVALTEAVVECIRIRCPGPVVDLDKVGSSTVFSAAFLQGLPGGGGHDAEPRCGPRRKKARTSRRLGKVIDPPEGEGH